MHRGLGLSLAAAFFAALFLIPYQAAVQSADRGSVVAAMLFAAALFNTIVALREGRSVFRIDAVGMKTAVFLTVMTVVGNTAIAWSLPQIGAGMTSVVMKAQVILIPFIAWLFIDERITRPIIIGAAVGMVGVVVMRLGDAGLDSSAVTPWWALLAATTFGAMQVVTRKVIHRIRPTQVNALRLWLSVGVLLLIPEQYGGGRLMDLGSKTWMLAAAAGLMGPGVSRLCLMFAVRYVTASFTALVSLCGPVFAFVLGYVAFNEWPSDAEALGALIILAGVSWPILRSRSSAR